MQGEMIRMSGGVKTLACLAALIVAALAVVYPVFGQWGLIGLSDWDNQLFYHAVAVRTILEHGQVPLWNPYHCGGTPMLASPEVGFPSPPFLFALVWGEVVGVKLMVVFYAVAGMWGMYLLSRTLGFERASSLVPPAVFMASSWFTLRVTEGHAGFMQFALLPFVVAFYLRSMEARGPLALRPMALAAFFYAWMILSGGVYPFTATSIFLAAFALLLAAQRRGLRPVVNLAIIVVFTFLLSAVKSIPQYEFISRYPRATEASQYHSAGILKDALFKREQRVVSQAPEFYQGAAESAGDYQRAFWGGERPWGWQEYGAYMGFITAVLFMAGLVFLRRLWVWYMLAFFALLLALGDYSPLNVWSVIRRLPVLGSLHGPSRVTVLFIFAASVIAGHVASRLEGAGFLKGRRNWGALASAVLAAVVFAELATVSAPVLKDAFVKPAYTIAPEKAFSHLVVVDPTATNYPYFLKNKGVINCYESQHPATRASAYGDDKGNLNPGYRGEAYMASGAGRADIVRFTPNVVEVDVSPAGEDYVVINQNWFTGWRADGAEAVDRFGLVAAKVDPGKEKVVFRYSPRSFRTGAVISALSFVILGAAAVLRWKG